jgi:hypothetical protein
LACSGKGKIVGITLIPVISTYRAKLGMIRGFGRCQPSSSPPEIAPRIIKLPEVGLKYKRMCGFADEGDPPGLKIYGKFRPIYPERGYYAESFSLRRLLETFSLAFKR